MSFRRRAFVVCLLLIVALAADATARFYSPGLVVYVFEQALMQKIPRNMDPALVRARLRDVLDRYRDRDGQLERVLAMSQYLEKVQTLTPLELDELLGDTHGK